MKTKKLKLISFLLLSLFIIETIGVLSHAGIISEVDNYFFSITSHHGSFSTGIFSVIATLGSPMVVIILSFILSFCIYIFQNHLLGIWILVTQLISSGIAKIIKILIHRPRPTHQLIPDTGFSYPSGHVFCTTILVLCLLLTFLSHIKGQEKKVIVFLIGTLWIILVAISRFYLRAHYFSDVLASTLLASSFWLFMFAIQKQFNQITIKIVTKLKPTKN
ncbi:phosphatase PAP2 family protein [Companilactobacillus sp. DQM5]|uniref:phosphatase PAP2 family protein n=1 Tax=Companilactobacillus sp. DQM5 TaxID=3463359 RepID=UPI004059A416